MIVSEERVQRTAASARPTARYAVRATFGPSTDHTSRLLCRGDRRAGLRLGGINIAIAAARTSVLKVCDAMDFAVRDLRADYARMAAGAGVLHPIVP